MWCSDMSAEAEADFDRYCSLIPGLWVKLSTMILAWGAYPVLSAEGRALRMMA